MIRKKKSYVRPKKLYEKSRIAEENKLVEEYGLKNKREIWKTLAKVNYFRHRAKDLAKSSNEEQEVLFSKLKELGLNIETTADVLALTIEDLLKRRITTILFKKGMANTVRQARQMVVHKKIAINDRIVNVPGYLVSLTEESQLSLRTKPKKPEPQSETTGDEKQ